MATLSLQGLRKSFGPLEVVHGVDLEIADREFVVLVGPSGCGKSTILRMIAGLEDISSGRVLIDGAIVNNREPKDRDIAMVFQDYALYPHMTVYDNLAFGLRYRHVRRPEIRRRVEEAARVLEIGALMERMPRELSGGQRQRVAMGRAIVRDPKIFLFDEPLSNLDAKLRGQMRTELKKLRARVSITTVFVTHDQVEAMTLADRIVVLHEGRVEQVGTPEEVYEKPASAFVAGFIGAPPMNLLPARLLAVNGRAAVVLDEGTALPLPTLPSSPREVLCGIRAEHLVLADGSDPRPRVRAEVTAVEPLGPDTLVSVAVAGREMVCRLPPGRVRTSGGTISLSVDPLRVHLFDRATERRLQTNGRIK
jgi:ABC-type sugar transport system ATPase subunit